MPRAIPSPSSRVWIGALAGAFLVALAARPAGAQIFFPGGSDAEGGPSGSAAAGYVALTLTPVGALAMPADYLFARPGAALGPMRAHARAGAIERGPGISQRVFAATLDLPAMGALVSLTGGYVDSECDDYASEGDPAFPFALECRGGITLGARLGRPLWSRAFDELATTIAVVGVEATAGFASVNLAEYEDDVIGVDATARALSASVALPIGLAVESENMVVLPMLTPRVGYGHARLRYDSPDFADASDAGLRFALGASVGVRLGQRFGFEAGAQQVFIEQGELAYSLGASVAF